MAGGFIIKLKGPEMSLSTANNIPQINATSNVGASLVRIVNNTTSLVVITQAGSISANCSVLPNTEVFIQKLPADTLAATGNTVLATPVSFRD